MKRYILGLTIVPFLFCFGAYAAEYADGKLGQALIHDGSSHTVKVPHYAGLKPAKAITISAWIKPERVGKGGWQWQQIYRKEDGNARALMAIGEYEKKHSLCFGLAINTSGAATCSSHRCTKKVRRPETSIFPLANGTTGGPAKPRSAAAPCSAPWIWPRCRSTSAPARSCRWTPSVNTPDIRSTGPRRSRSTEVPTANTRCTTTTASALITSRAIQSRH